MNGKSYEHRKGVSSRCLPTTSEADTHCHKPRFPLLRTCEEKFSVGFDLTRSTFDQRERERSSPTVRYWRKLFSPTNFKRHQPGIGKRRSFPITLSRWFFFSRLTDAGLMYFRFRQSCKVGLYFCITALPLHVGGCHEVTDRGRDNWFMCRVTMEDQQRWNK